jgi:hypothetical protein
VNVDLLRKDREDELEVGAADNEEVEYLAGAGGASFVDMAKGTAEAKRKRAKKKQPQKLLSSPAKGTRSAAASFRFKHPVLTMNVPDASVTLRDDEPTAAQMERIQSQLNTLQQLVVEGIGLATASRNADLASLYQSISLEMEVQYTGTRLTLPLLERTRNLTHLQDIARALGPLADPRYTVAAVPEASAKVQKRSNAFFSPAVDSLLAWGLGRMYKPETYAGEPFAFSTLVTHYFPLFSGTALSLRHRNKDIATARDNPLKAWTRALKSKMPWSTVEQCRLLQWSRRYPRDEGFEEAAANVGESQLRHREPQDMKAERLRLRLVYPNREAEDAVMREHKFHILNQDEEEVVDVRAFDVEDIDSGSDEELGVIGPPHPRQNPGDWSEDADRVLLRLAAAELKSGTSGEPSDALLAAAARALPREGVAERFKAWWSVYNAAEGKKRHKAQ